MEAFLQILAGNDLDTISLMLERMQVSDLEMDEADDLFTRLISAVNSVEVAGLLVEKWNDSFYAQIPYHIYIFRLFGITLNQLKMISTATLATGREVIMALIEAEDEQINGVAIEKALTVFSEDLNRDQIREMIEHAKTWEKYHATQVLEESYRDLAPQITQPEWIVDEFTHTSKDADSDSDKDSDKNADSDKDTDKDSQLPTQEELMNLLPPPYQLEPFVLPSDSKIVELFLSGLEAQGYSVEFINSGREQLLEKISSMSESQKLEMYRPIAYELQQRDRIESDQIFRILGPVNPLVDEEYNDKSSPCARYGGCRMLTCTHLVFNGDDQAWGIVNDEPLDEREWFTGVCQTCNKKIPHKFWAVRRPIPMGAWEGTYCSIECVRNDPEVKSSEEALLISFFENLLKSKGIQNRAWS